MIPKQRMTDALTRQEVDRLPWQINFTRMMGQKMARHFGIDFSELAAFLGNHLLRVDLSGPARRGAVEGLLYDWWGAGFSPDEEGYFVSDSPLAHSKDLDAYPWPDPRAPGLLDAAARAIKDDSGQRFVAPNFGFALFERAWTLRGLTALMMDMVSDPPFVHAFLDRIVDIQLVLISRFIGLGVDGAYFGDDYGAQKNLLFSPRMWREFIKPRLARLFAPFTRRGLPVIMHSDGDIKAILPDLVEIGLTVLNPVQPEVMDQAWLAQEFGGKLAFYGGISTQSVLSSGSPAQVREAVKQCAGALAPKGTGLLLAPSHRMMSDIPMQNVEALLSAIENM